ncbi:MAG: hypothetical protein AAGD96_30760, partial [Chloroflexota bacterium]
ILLNTQIKLNSMFKTKSRSNRITPAGKEKIVLAQLSLAVAFIMLAFSSCSTARSYRKLANSRITTVQMNNGDAILAEVKSGNYRTPETITEFTKKWYTLMLGWSGGETAVKVNGNTIPANSYAAAQMMDTRLQKAFLPEFSQLIPASVFTQDNQLKSSAKVRYVSEPVPLSEDTWGSVLCGFGLGTKRRQAGCLPRRNERSRFSDSNDSKCR